MRQWVAAVWCVFGLSCGNSAPLPQTNASPQTLPYDRAFSRLADAGRFSGSVLVALPDTIFEQSYRMPDAPEHMHVASNYRYPIGELNQLLLRAAYFRLADDGRLNLNSAVGDALPLDIHDERYGGDQRGIINYRMLLDHRAGLPEQRDPRATSLQQLIAQPGIEEHYSPLGYELLARMLANRLSVSVADALRVLVLEPAQMSHTAVLDLQALPGVLATPFSDASGTLQAIPYSEVVSPTPTALPEYASTITDLFYLSQWLPESAYRKGQLVQPGVRPGCRAYFRAAVDGSHTAVVLSNFGGVDLGEVKRLVQAEAAAR